MILINSLIIIIWLILIAKAILFWLYLWQLKEYHLKRFLDHFRTQKGKQLLLNPIRFVKIALIILLLFSPYLLWPFLIVYIGELALTVIKRRVKKPVFTAKIAFLSGLNLLLFFALGLYFNLKLTGLWLVPALVITDVLAPPLISLIVLLSQPLTTLMRQRIINQAENKREKFKDLIVIGITGSYGKTSTKEFLATILSKKFMVLKTRENQNSEIGISRCILDELKPEHQIFICEMGAYDKGKIKQVADMAKPNIGIVTGVNEQHLALFGSMENLVSAEGGGELLESLSKNGIFILNGDNEAVKSKYQVPSTPSTPSSGPRGKYQSNPESQIQKTIFCSTKEKLDFWAENITVEKDWLYFRVCDKTGESADFKVSLVGRQNIENILLAAVCAKELGMTLAEIALACEKIKPDQGPIKLVLNQVKHKADILDSTYSANPDGVLAALEHLKLWTGSKIIIMPCLIELGPAAKTIHERIGNKIGEICDLAIITTKDWFEEIKTAALNAGIKPENIVFSENPQKIFARIKNFNKPGDVILFEGMVPQALLDRFKNKTVPAI